MYKKLYLFYYQNYVEVIIIEIIYVFFFLPDFEK